MSSARIERAACCLGGNRSILLSYEDKKKSITEEPVKFKEILDSP